MTGPGSFTLTRREFVVASGATLAACALGSGWSAPAEAAASAAPPHVGPGSRLRGDGNVERTTTHADGTWRVYRWQRGAGTECVELAPPPRSPDAAAPSAHAIPEGAVRITSAFRGVEDVPFEALLRGVGHETIRADLGSSALEEVLWEVALRAV